VLYFLLINESNVYKYQKPFKTHIFSLTRNNNTAVYHSLTVPVAVRARIPANCAEEETLPTEASSNWCWKCYRKHIRSVSLSLSGRCMICFNNCTNLCAYWNRKHGEVTKGVKSPAYTTYDDGRDRVFWNVAHKIQRPRNHPRGRTQQNKRCWHYCIMP